MKVMRFMDRRSISILKTALDGPGNAPQFNWTLPCRSAFDLTYIDEDNERKRPVMIHRVLYGALERFMAILVEHTAGLSHLACSRAGAGDPRRR